MKCGACKKEGPSTQFKPIREPGYKFVHLVDEHLFLLPNVCRACYATEAQKELAVQLTSISSEFNEELSKKITAITTEYSSKLDDRTQRDVEEEGETLLEFLIASKYKPQLAASWCYEKHDPITGTWSPFNEDP